MSGVVDLDDQATWPQHVLDYLSQSEAVLLSYLNEENRLDQEREELKHRRLFAPPRSSNRYFQDRARCLLALKDLVRDEQILGYHCTRLTNEEVAEVKAQGLSLLSPELLRLKIGKLGPCYSENAVFRHLVEDNSSASQYRRNQICFLAGATDLRCESSTSDLFRFWGGEALRDLHEDSPEMMNELAGIGRPRLVLAKVGLADSECHQSFHEAMANGFLAFRHGCNISLGCDVFCRKPVEAKNIIDVFDQDDGRFEEIVQTRSWLTPLI